MRPELDFELGSDAGEDEHDCSDVLQGQRVLKRKAREEMATKTLAKGKAKPAGPKAKAKAKVKAAAKKKGKEQANPEHEAAAADDVPLI